MNFHKAYAKSSFVWQCEGKKAPATATVIKKINYSNT